MPMSFSNREHVYKTRSIHFNPEKLPSGPLYPTARISFICHYALPETRSDNNSFQCVVQKCLAVILCSYSLPSSQLARKPSVNITHYAPHSSHINSNLTASTKPGFRMFSWHFYLNTRIQGTLLPNAGTDPHLLSFNSAVTTQTAIPWRFLVGTTERLTLLKQQTSSIV